MAVPPSLGLLDSCAQYLRKRCRCQRTTVSGCTWSTTCDRSAL